MCPILLDHVNLPHHGTWRNCWLGSIALSLATCRPLLRHWYPREDIASSHFFFVKVGFVLSSVLASFSVMRFYCQMSIFPYVECVLLYCSGFIRKAFVVTEARQKGSACLYNVFLAFSGACSCLQELFSHQKTSFTQWENNFS